MRKFEDWVGFCPKCQTDMADASVVYREPAWFIGSMADWTQPPNDRLEVSCPRCGWSYDMEPADKRVEVAA